MKPAKLNQLFVRCLVSINHKYSSSLKRWNLLQPHSSHDDADLSLLVNILNILTEYFICSSQTQHSAKLFCLREDVSVDCQMKGSEHWEDPEKRERTGRTRVSCCHCVQYEILECITAPHQHSSLPSSHSSVHNNIAIRTKTESFWW